MSKVQNYGVKDPQIDESYDEIDLLDETEIVINGKLTSYGERLYEQSREYYYDEETEEWILI